MTPEEIRRSATNIALSVVGLGDTEARRQDYLALLGPGETEAMQQAMLAMSACGLTVAGIWRRVGVTHPEIEAPYQIGTAISRLMSIAIELSAWRAYSASQLPEPGDMVLIGGGTGGAEHVLTVLTASATGSGTATLTSVDGGQVDAQGRAAILRKTRTWKDGLDTSVADGVDIPLGGSARAIRGYISIAALAPLIQAPEPEEEEDAAAPPKVLPLRPLHPREVPLRPLPARPLPSRVTPSRPVVEGRPTTQPEVATPTRPEGAAPKLPARLNLSDLVALVPAWSGAAPPKRVLPEVVSRLRERAFSAEAAASLAGVSPSHLPDWWNAGLPFDPSRRGVLVEDTWEDYAAGSGEKSAGKPLPARLVAKIRAAREGVPKAAGLRAVTALSGGYMHTGFDDSELRAHIEEQIDQALAGKSPAEARKLRCFRTFLDREGLTSAVNTYDGDQVTLGVGFRGPGLLWSLLREVTRDPSIHAQLDACGFLPLAKGGFAVADLEAGVVVSGTEAALAVVRKAPDLLHLWIHLARDPASRGAITSAQIEVFTKRSATHSKAEGLATQALFNFATRLQHWRPKWMIFAVASAIAEAGGRPSEARDKRLVALIGKHFYARAMGQETPNWAWFQGFALRDMKADGLDVSGDPWLQAEGPTDLGPAPGPASEPVTPPIIDVSSSFQDYAPGAASDVAGATLPEGLLREIAAARAAVPVEAGLTPTSAMLGGYMYGGMHDDAHVAYLRAMLAGLSAAETGVEKRKIEAFLATLPREGTTAAINTYDNMLVTWGVGFGGRGLLGAAVDLMWQDQGFRNKLLACGLRVDGKGEWSVVDEASKRVVSGKDDALRVIRLSTPLLHLLIDAARSQATRDAVTKAQLTIFGRHSASHEGAEEVATQALFNFVTHLKHWAPAYAIGALPYAAAQAGGTLSEERDRRMASQIGRYFYARAAHYTWKPSFTQFLGYALLDMKTDGLDVSSDPWFSEPTPTDLPSDV